MNQGWKNKRHTLVLALRIFAHYNKLHFATTTHTDTHTPYFQKPPHYKYTVKNLIVSFCTLCRLFMYLGGHSTTTWTWIFLTPPLAWTVFIPWSWTKTNIFYLLPLSSCPRSYWMAPKQTSINCIKMQYSFLNSNRFL